jgi:hypothetical protein
MTNILATITFAVVTNWTTIGTYTPINGQVMQVQQGNIRTNTEMMWMWKGRTNYVCIDVEDGPAIGERRIPSPAVNWYQQPNIIVSNIPMTYWSNQAANAIIRADWETNKMQQLKDAIDNRLHLMTP